MTELEANQIAEAIRNANLPGLRVERIELHNGRYQVKCGYSGPHKRCRIGDTVHELIHGIALWVKSPRDWVELATIIQSGQEVFRCVFSCHQEAGEPPCYYCGRHACASHSRLTMSSGAQPIRICAICDHRAATVFQGEG